MESEPFFGNWMVAVVEAAEVAGAAELDEATVDQLTKAWGLVREAADITLSELTARIAEQSHLRVADLDAKDPHATMLVPAGVARQRNILPLRVTEKELVVATSNPLSQEVRRQVGQLTSREVTFEVAPPNELASAVEATYGPPLEGERGDVPIKQPETAQPSGPHVLVVDDEAGQRALFRSILEEGGFRVEVARDGEEAIQMLRKPDRFALVTLDYWMDKMNGLRVLQMIRSDPAVADVPVIMVTGADDRQIEMSLFEAGADDFIVKPVDGPLFILRIQAVLRRRQLG